MPTGHVCCWVEERFMNHFIRLNGIIDYECESRSIWMESLHSQKRWKEGIPSHSERTVWYFVSKEHEHFASFSDLQKCFHGSWDFNLSSSEATCWRAGSYSRNDQFILRKQQVLKPSHREVDFLWRMHILWRWLQNDGWKTRHCWSGPITCSPTWIHCPSFVPVKCVSTKNRTPTESTLISAARDLQSMSCVKKEVSPFHMHTPYLLADFW